MAKEQLKKLRQYLSLNQQGMADKMSIKQSYYSAIERGVKPITLKTIAKLNEIFGVDRNWLLTGVGEMFLAEGGPQKAELKQCGPLPVLTDREKLTDEFAKVIIAALISNPNGITVGGKLLKTDLDYAKWSYDMAETMILEKFKRISKINLTHKS